MVLQAFPNTSSSISSSIIVTALSYNNSSVTDSARYCIGKKYYSPSTSTITVTGPTVNWNQFRGNMYEDGTPYPPGPGAPPAEPSCFLSGSIVMMAYNAFKVIEEILPGDKIIGAFGEINEVLAIEQVILGNRWMYNINGEHNTTGEHPHISADKKFYAFEPEMVYGEWGGSYEVLTANGKEQWINYGLTKHKVTNLEKGIVLQTLNGPKELENIQQYNMPSHTPLYNLVVNGSHTYTVDGYAVTGWPREDDFDYDAWIKK